MEFPIGIKVRAGKGKTAVVGEENKILVVDVKGKAEDNKANIEIIRFFSRIAGRRVRILKGLKSKRKIIG